MLRPIDPGPCCFDPRNPKRRHQIAPGLPDPAKPRSSRPEILSGPEQVDASYEYATDFLPADARGGMGGPEVECSASERGAHSLARRHEDRKRSFALRTAFHYRDRNSGRLRPPSRFHRKRTRRRSLQGMPAARLENT